MLRQVMIVSALAAGVLAAVAYASLAYVWLIPAGVLFLLALLAGVVRVIRHRSFSSAETVVVLVLGFAVGAVALLPSK
jgi:hypothetical protein